jgi:hypothetical protein
MKKSPKWAPGVTGSGHHRDQQAAVPARLEAEPGPEMVEMLLEPAPLVAERRAGQPAEPARDEAHTDAGCVKVRRGDHSIRAHRHLPVVGAMRLRRADGVKRPDAAAVTSSATIDWRQQTAPPVDRGGAGFEPATFGL